MRLPLLVLALVLAVAAPAAAKTELASDGSVRAELSYVPGTDGERPTDIVERVFADGERIVQRRIPNAKGYYPGGGLEDVSVAVRDLDGDGTAEAIFDLFTGGAHCCLISDVYNGTRRQTFDWGNVGYEFVDYDSDGLAEFSTTDDRFSGLYSAYAFSVRPLVALKYTPDGLEDFTRDPSVVKALKDHAKEIKQVYQRVRERNGIVAREVIVSALAAYTADRCSIGDCGSGYALIGKAIERGDVRKFDDFLPTVRKDLRKFDYDR